MPSANTDATSSRNSYQLGTQFFLMGPLGSSVRDQQCGFGVSRPGNLSTGAFVVFSLPSVSKAVLGPVAGSRSCCRTLLGCVASPQGALPRLTEWPSHAVWGRWLRSRNCCAWMVANGTKSPGRPHLAPLPDEEGGPLDSSITVRAERLPSGLLSERIEEGRGQVLEVGDQQGNGRLPFHNAGSPGRAWRRW